MGIIESNIIKLFIIVIMMIYLSSCDRVIDSISKPWLLDTTPPPGPPIYQAAYVDGCSSAMQENSFNSMAKRNRVYKHPVYNKTSNLYRKLWRTAMTYCYLWVPKLTRGSFFTPNFQMKIKGLPGSQKKIYLTSAPPGPLNFRIGWKDGCSTGKAATGSNKHRMKFGFKKDPRFIEGDKFNLAYEKGWETAFWYCQRYYDIYENPGRKSLM